MAAAPVETIERALDFYQRNKVDTLTQKALDFYVKHGIEPFEVVDICPCDATGKDIGLAVVMDKTTPLVVRQLDFRMITGDVKTIVNDVEPDFVLYLMAVAGLFVGEFKETVKLCRERSLQRTQWQKVTTVPLGRIERMAINHHQLVAEALLREENTRTLRLHRYRWEPFTRFEKRTPDTDA